MKVLLFSNDEKLAAFCREILTEMCGEEAKVQIGTPGQLPTQESLCLWDFIPGETGIPKDFDTARLSSHLFLVHRQDLPALQQLLGTSDINVLLKPVNPASLRTFLGEAGRHDEGDPSRRLRTLRVERDEMLQFLIQANLRLQEYDQERTNFLARSLHDIRAPLSAISGYCSLLLEEELGAVAPDQRDALGRIQRGATQLSRIANAMFQLSVGRRATQELNLQTVDVRECVDQVLHEIALLLEDKRISVTVEIQPPPAGLFFDKGRIEQTLVYLLDNARKFTPRNGAIDIRGYPYFWERRICHAAGFDASVDRRRGQVPAPNSFRVDIHDSGPGIPSVHVGKIFEEYSSYAGGEDRSGGGLDLAICRMILQQHEGRVWAESHAAGAVFCFVLPLRSQDACMPTKIENHRRACLARVEEGWL